MSSPPPGARISDDGKWWWDGNRWVAMPAEQQIVQAPPGSTGPPGPPGAGYMAPAYAAARPTNSMAVVSLVAGIAAWVICPLISAVVAIITGHIARGQIKQTGESGSGLALAGLILGYAHVAVAFLVGVFWIVVLGGLAAFSTIMGNLPSPTPSP